MLPQPQLVPLLVTCCLLAAEAPFASAQAASPREQTALREEQSLAAALKDMNGDRTARRSARQRLIELGPAAVPALIEFLGNEQWSVRWEAVNNLGYLGDLRAVAPLVRLVVEDPSNHVRWRAWWAVKVTDPLGETAMALFRSRLEDSSPVFRWNAAVGMTMYNEAGSEILALVQAGLRSPDSWVRWEAANALGRLGLRKAISSLREVLRDPEASVRREVANALGALGGGEAVELLLVLLEDEDVGVRLRAGAALARTGEPSAIAALERSRAKESDPWVLSVLDAALKDLYEN